MQTHNQLENQGVPDMCQSNTTEYVVLKKPRAMPQGAHLIIFPSQHPINVHWEKIGHMTDNKNQVQEAKDRVYHTAQTAKDGTTETKNQTGSYLSEKIGAANDKVSAVAQLVKESAQAERDKTTAVLEKTAVKVKGNN
ncbi:hypothetical protein RHSIM_Rhsim12G0193200 [Rhododendron simsii]|uniref:Uncharacterized protein n=1 Tax=Rhododendron simsii TaxID=118357 RepID=A0A834L9L8_RHOSS|nr:hypothetical protein RHSIM_Rhsim12G0193200 [Rhododendron simsii]